MKKLLLVGAALALGGCQAVVLEPAGDVAIQQRNLIYIATALMLIVIIPVMVMTVVFAWKYRAGNEKANYDPNWDHSTKIELAVWSVPLLIIVVLGAVTWTMTHLLDPYRPLGRLDSDKAIIANVEPLKVEVVSLDWKWLFIYPQYGVASLNVMAAPVDRPIEFSLTSTVVMNSFYVPALAGMIYTMPGMETKLHAVINEPGDFDGFSANYSGKGFSEMRFNFMARDDAGFDEWIESVRASEEHLDRTLYRKLEAPTVSDPERLFGSVDPDLFDLIVNMCVDPAKMCMSEMMAIDRNGGLGLAGIHNTLPETGLSRGVARASVFGPAPRYLAAICTPDEAIAALREIEKPEVRDRFKRLTSLNLPQPHEADMTPIMIADLAATFEELASDGRRTTP